jgi:hypothetical protein
VFIYSFDLGAIPCSFSVEDWQFVAWSMRHDSSSKLISRTVGAESSFNSSMLANLEGQIFDNWRTPGLDKGQEIENSKRNSSR